MWNVKIKGRPQNVSREEARAWIFASLTLLCYHNLHPVAGTLIYQFKKKLENMGEATRNSGWVVVRSTLDDQEIFTTIVHETIHLCAEFPEGTEEACTTTLCSRIKEDVAALAAILVKNTYRRAAAIAHCKISYPPEEGMPDFYNGEEDRVIPWEENKYRDKRKKGGR